MKDTYFCAMQSFVEYKGNQVFYTSEGKGSAVVLLHGFLENSSMWNTISKYLIKKHRVVIIDLLGHGKTGCVGYVHTMEEMAEAVHAVLKSLRLRKVTLIGHSMGGYVALAYAKKYFTSVKALCLLNSTVQADSEERKELRERACNMAQTNYEALVSMSVTNLFAQDSKELFADEITKVKNEALKTTVQGYIAATKGMMQRENLEKVFARIDKKLIISGKEDPIIDVNSIKEEASRTQSTLVFLPKGHMSYVEAKQELIAVLLKFLKA